MADGGLHERLADGSPAHQCSMEPGGKCHGHPIVDGLAGGDRQPAHRPRGAAAACAWVEHVRGEGLPPCLSGEKGRQPTGIGHSRRGPALFEEQLVVAAMTAEMKDRDLVAVILEPLRRSSTWHWCAKANRDRAGPGRPAPQFLELPDFLRQTGQVAAIGATVVGKGQQNDWFGRDGHLGWLGLRYRNWDDLDVWVRVQQQWHAINSRAAYVQATMGSEQVMSSGDSSTHARNWRSGTGPKPCGNGSWISTVLNGCRCHVLAVAG